MKKYLLFAICLWSSLTYAAWPTKEITIVVPYQPGGVNDILARHVQQDLEIKYRVPVVVKNLPGAGNAVAINSVLGSPNDNHTFILSMDDFIAGPLFQGTNTYKQFKAVTVIGQSPFIVFGNNKTSVAQFKQEIKEGATVNIANAGINGGADLWIKQLQSNLKFNPIPYKGTPPIITDTQSGVTKYGILSLSSPYSQIKNKTLIPIMVSSATRNPLYPDVPTFHELGFKGVRAGTWFAILTPLTTNSEATLSMSKAVQESVANNANIQEFQTKGLHLINLNLEKSNNFYNQEILRFETFKANQ